MVPSPLPSNFPLPNVRYFASVGSTNDEAMAWAAEGAPDMALVVADEQTAGRGRFQRRWLTPAGTALAFSLVVRPRPAESHDLGVFSPWGALGVARALESLGLRPEVKWPNDVLLDRRKVCGILVESSWLGDTAQVVVMGIGVNVARAAAPPDSETLFPATSVEAVLGRLPDRWALLVAITGEMQALREHLGTPAFYGEWESRLAFRGERVRLSSGIGRGEDRVGILKGLGPGGALRLLLDNGRETLVQVGEVHLRPE